MTATSGGKSDAKIQEDVMHELAWDTRVHAPEIGVEVRSGIVTLSGYVDDWAKRDAAQAAAHRVAGVLDVANEVKVRLPGSRERSDADIAKAVRDALVWDVRVLERQIHSTVSNGHVKLSGSVSYWSQREDAELCVRYLAGVKGVTNSITVTPPQVSPGEVRGAITNALERHALREAKHISLSVADGHVLLSGVVHSWAERNAVVGAAGATSGVRSVDDRLRVEPWN